MSAPGYDLTARQRELLAYIRTRELCPTFDEMRQALGVRSKASVVRILTSLQRRGYIRRLPRRARAIEATPVIQINGKPFLFISNEARRALRGAR